MSKIADEPFVPSDKDRAKYLAELKEFVQSVLGAVSGPDESGDTIVNGEGEVPTEGQQLPNGYTVGKSWTVEEAVEQSNPEFAGHLLQIIGEQNALIANLNEQLSIYAKTVGVATKVVTAERQGVRVSKAMLAKGEFDPKNPEIQKCLEVSHEASRELSAHVLAMAELFDGLEDDQTGRFGPGPLAVVFVDSAEDEFLHRVLMDA